MRNRIRKGFTLVEILIVVVILGILAAIVVPQFTNATQDAQAGNLKAQIKSIQNQIELFKARNQGGDGLYPVIDGADATAWVSLIDPLANGNDGTIVNGVSNTADAYIKEAPKNPFNGSVAVAAARAAGNGWAYDRATGTLQACYFNGVSITPDTP